VVALALGKRPETRYQNGDQFAADLKSMLAEMSSAPMPAPAPRSGPVTPPGVVLRPDDEVPVGAADKTAVLAVGPRQRAAEAAFESTMVGIRPAAAPAPGYDPTQQKDGGDPAFAKTEVFRKPGGPGGAGGA
jgi:serine/threonine-protein kinase